MTSVVKFCVIGELECAECREGESVSLEATDGGEVGVGEGVESAFDTFSGEGTKWDVNEEDGDGEGVGHNTDDVLFGDISDGIAMVTKEDAVDGVVVDDDTIDEGNVALKDDDMV